MERRKFLIGAGSAAVGSSALIGSGAFNTVRADRDITVEIVDDEDAYLTLESESDYSEGSSDGQLEVSFDDGVDDADGEGLSENANYYFTDVFSIKNAGPETINVTLSENTGSIEWNTTYPRALYSVNEKGTDNSVAGNEFGNDAGPELESGDKVYVHFEFVGRDVERGAQKRGDDSDLDSQVPETIGVYAEARGDED